jgi:uncharacterized membrane protein HdeD (DUF308 family)
MERFVMSTNTPDVERLQAAMRASLHEHWALYLGEGILLLIFGLTAVTVPPLATIAIEAIVGWIFLLSGIIGLVTTFWMRRAPGFWWALLSAILGIAAGAILIAWPANGAFSLTVIVIAFFMIEGIASIMFALEHKRERSGRWGVMLFSGIVDLLLAGMLFMGLPGTAAWAIGLLVGINMVFGGVALIAMALHARTVASGSIPKAA